MHEWFEMQPGIRPAPNELDTAEYRTFLMESDKFTCSIGAYFMINFRPLGEFEGAFIRSTREGRYSAFLDTICTDAAPILIDVFIRRYQATNNVVTF